MLVYQVFYCFEGCSKPGFDEIVVIYASKYIYIYILGAVTANSKGISFFSAPSKLKSRIDSLLISYYLVRIAPSCVA